MKLEGFETMGGGLCYIQFEGCGEGGGGRGVRLGDGRGGAWWITRLRMVDHARIRERGRGDR